VFDVVVLAPVSDLPEVSPGVEELPLGEDIGMGMRIVVLFVVVVLVGAAGV
jgi:hypothetical protein